VVVHERGDLAAKRGAFGAELVALVHHLLRELLRLCGLRA
jgi:hypothetical protein